MTGKMSRNKGAAFEREIVNRLKPIFPNVSRNLEQTRDGGHDIAMPGMLLECKVGKQPNIRAAMKQCKVATTDAMAKQGETKHHLHAVVVSKKDREEILVTLPWEAFEELLEAVYGRKEHVE